MKASRYNIIVEDEASGATILYNSLYGSLTTFDPREAPVIKVMLADPSRTDEESPQLAHALTEQQFLVEESSDELGIVKRRKLAGIEDPNRLDILLMPTLNCNFACVYCYETVRPSRMTDQVEEAIRIWISSEFSRRKVAMVYWYGGEPLLEYQRVLALSKYCLTVAQRSGIDCNVQVTTNGYFLTRQRIAELIGCGIVEYQITIDGPPDTHDKLRVLRNGNGTFDRLFRNINQLARFDDRVKISLRVNFNHSNLDAIPRLLNLFPVDVRPHLRVVYEPIFGCSRVSAADNLSCRSISESMAQYYGLAERLGYDVVLGLANIFTGKLVYCYAERQNQIIINYNGDVYKCGIGNFLAQDRVGYIRSDGVLVKEDKKWNLWAGRSDLFEQKCEACVYLPLCMGGCRKTRLEKCGTGSYCSLVPTNSSYLLKELALGGFEKVLIRQTNTAS
jgi:uncharacterized protein